MYFYGVEYERDNNYTFEVWEPVSDVETEVITVTEYITVSEGDTEASQRTSDLSGNAVLNLNGDLAILELD